MRIERKVEWCYKYDVVVVGGGIAGVSAAVAAAREGIKVLLVEKQVNLGGLATSGLISWYEPLCDGKGQQVTYGIAEELIKLTTKLCFDNLPSKWGGYSGAKPRNERYSTYYSPTVFSAQLDTYVLESGAEILFDCIAVEPIMDGNICKGITTESADGCSFFEADVVIDATGDAMLSHRAGIPTIVGENFMTYIAHYYDVEMADKLVSDKNTCAFRKWINSGSDMYGEGHPKGMRKLTGVSCRDITDYMIAGKKSLLSKLSKINKNTYDIMTIPAMPQFRTIRRIKGNADFNALDDMNFDTSIGCCSDFRPNQEGKHYQIPFGALYNDSYPNIIAAGRIISAPKGDGWEVARVIPTCALTGEAAGKAAAICVKEQKKLTEFTRDDINKIKIN